ncbi:MAG: hypothetical protein JST93_13530 [Acidobacteria bacterium]|nr:hypothetical protein [Acidobacteriota bacterium]
MLPKEAVERISADSWNRAVYAYGTGELFLRRSLHYTKLLQALAFFGIIVPLLIGGVVLGFGTKVNYLDTLIYWAAAAGVVQLVFSAWSIVYAWAENLQYSLESTADNRDLATQFSELGGQVAAPPNDIEVRFERLKTRDDARRAADVKRSVSEKEMRYAHRAGLRRFGRKCEGCGEIPKSMKPEGKSKDCPVCGRF